MLSRYGHICLSGFIKIRPAGSIRGKELIILHLLPVPLYNVSPLDIPELHMPLCINMLYSVFKWLFKTNIM